MNLKSLLPALLLALTAGAAQAAWVAEQPQADPVHKAVARVVLDGCVVSEEQWSAVYTELGGNPEDAAFHVQMMFKHGEVITEPDGRLKLIGVPGC